MRTSASIPLDANIVRGTEQVSCDFEEDTVILNILDGMYYELSDVGARVWELVESPRTFQEIEGVILDEYEVDPARCREDIERLIGELASKGLVEVRGA